MTVWVVRAGKHGERENLALESGRVFIGWTNLPDLSGIEKREQILELWKQSDPDCKLGTLSNHAGQVFHFLKSIQNGDIVALPLKTRPAIAFGKVSGDYEYVADNPEDARHSRRIEWIDEPISRSAFDQDLFLFFWFGFDGFSCD